MNDSPVALITGGARRIGARITQRLHEAGYRVVIHYRQSEAPARALADELNARRPDSAATVQADLNQLDDIEHLGEQTLAQWQRLDVLINNASGFYPTPVGQASAEQWDDLMGANLKAPFFLVQCLAEELDRREGRVVNIVDIHAERPLKNHPIYCAAKAGNAMLVKSLARELAPRVRVNGVAPGAILWPEQQAELDERTRAQLIERVPLKRQGEPDDIAETVLFLADHSPYITGQILPVDGGRSLT